MKSWMRSLILPLGTAATVAVSVTGCQSPLEHLSAGSHGFACCDAGDACSAPHEKSRAASLESYPLPTLPRQAANEVEQRRTSGACPLASLFSRQKQSDQRQGEFSCGENARRTHQIRSQSLTPEPFPGSQTVNGPQAVSSSEHAESRWGDERGGTDGLARVSPATANRAIPLGQFSHVPTAIQQTSAVSFTQADPRLAISVDGRPLADPGETWMDGRAYEQYPDEYILDGGDRDHPVHYQGPYREGLETEDTVTEYLDHTGKPHVKATNRVAIYAPRFAAVEAITTPTGEMAIARLGSMHESTRDSGVSNRVGPQRYTDSQKLGGVRVRSRASGLNNREWQSGTFNVARLGSHTKLLNTYEELSYFLRGEMKQANEARLAAGIEAAVEWTREQNPMLIAQLDSLHEVTAKFRLAEMVGIEDPRKEPGWLEIVKVANRSTAKPGDIVTFAIRYENKGERELTNVRIVDNLTPRLEYIEDSATSDLPGDIIVQDNEEGSLVLTFKLDEPLKEKTGGLITFQCRVR